MGLVQIIWLNLLIAGVSTYIFTFSYRVVLQQETEKYTQQRVVITNLKLSLNEALTQNTKYREKLNRIKGIVNSDSETQYFEDYCDNDSHTLPIIQVSYKYILCYSGNVNNGHSTRGR